MGWEIYFVKSKYFIPVILSLKKKRVFYATKLFDEKRLEMKAEDCSDKR